ncbi:UGMP family protein [Paenibacillus sp. NAIST15-1]|nr:UGMP family protein [Paenibacillus sp. NAIST15-1]
MSEEKLPVYVPGASTIELPGLTLFNALDKQDAVLQVISFTSILMLADNGSPALLLQAKAWVGTELITSNKIRPYTHPRCDRNVHGSAIRIPIPPHRIDT